MSENVMIPTLITKLKNIALNLEKYAYKPWSASCPMLQYRIPKDVILLYAIT